MKRILITAISGMLWLAAFSQPKGMQPRSTYEMVDEVRKELKLDHKQFEKVYSAYEKYNKAIFGNVDKNASRPTPPSGGPGGGHRGGGPGMPPGGGGRPDFGGGPSGSHHGFDGQRPGKPGNDSKDIKPMKPEDIEKMEKKRAKQEEKLVKEIKKVFKKDPEAFAKWQVIRNRQLKQQAPMPPTPGTGKDSPAPNGKRP